MPVSASAALNVAGTDTDSRDYTTGSFTPTPGTVLVAALSVLDLGAQRTSVGVSDSSGQLTWQVVNASGGAANQPALGVFWAYVPPGGVGTITMTFSTVVAEGETADGAIWGVAEIAGTSSSPFVQSNVGSTNTDSLEVSLSAFASAANATGAWVLTYDNAGTNGPAITAGSGFSIVSGLNNQQAAGGDGMRLAFMFRSDNDTTVDASAAAANDRLLMVAFEIAALTVVTGAADLSGTGTLTASGTVVKVPVDGEAALSGTGTLAAAAEVEHEASAALSGTGTLAAAAEHEANASAALSGTGTLTATGEAEHNATSALTGTGMLGASAEVEHEATAALTGTGTLTAEGTIVGTVTGEADLTGTGTLAATAEVDHNATAALSGTGTLSASGEVDENEAEGEAHLTGTGTLAASAEVEHNASASLEGTGTLNATGSIDGEEPPAIEEERFSGAPYSRRDIDRLVWEQQLEELLREDEEILCLV
jgi:fibronectin-binding autotransporter adhesin